MINKEKEYAPHYILIKRCLKKIIEQVFIKIIVFDCVDSQNNIHAINMVVWDNECAYYLLAMRKKEYNTSGGTELLVNEAIKYVSQFVDRFDFEGSMIKGVEESYRHYGAIQTEYYTISKMPNSTLKTYRALKEMFLEMGKHKA
jgi:hypothetical protein